MLAESVLPVSASQPTIKLWTPKVIGLLTFFLGFPSGITLASINWIKMGMLGKAIAHIGGLIVSLIVLFLLPDTFGRMFGLVVNLASVVYLRRQMEDDIGTIASHAIQYAHWVSGALISLMPWVVIIVGAIVIAFLEPFIPGTSPYYYTRGTDYFENGDYENAIANYNKSIELDPTDIYSYNNRGLSHAILGNLDSALADFNKEVELDPTYGKGFYNRALVYEDLGRTSDAIQDFEKAVELLTEPDLRNFAEQEIQKLRAQ